MHSIGVLGHSLGGSSALQLCGLDDTGDVKAGINLDGDIVGDNSTDVLKQPFLIVSGSNLYEAESLGKLEENVMEKWKEFYASSPKAHRLVLQNATHMAFSSENLFFNWGNPQSEIATPVKNITIPYVVDFFQTHLKGKTSKLFNERIICKVIEVYDRSLHLEKTATRLLKTDR